MGMAMSGFRGPLLLIVLSPILFALNLPAFTILGSATWSAGLMLAAAMSLIGGVVWGVRNLFRRA
jgi:hypothetical protein